MGYSIALLGFIPLYEHIPVLPRLVFACGLLTGLISEYLKKRLLHHYLLTTLATVLFLWYGAQFSRHNPAVPVVCILVVLLGTRLAAEKNPRTWLQTSAISLFSLSASSLFDLGPRFLLFMGLMLPMTALSLVLNTFLARGGASAIDRNAIRRLLLAGALIPLISLILTPVFFPILPRTQFPLWNFIQQAGGTQPSGLSDTVTPGAAASIPENGLLAFRAEMPVTGRQSLYWRGPTFTTMKGLVWQKEWYGIAQEETGAGGQTVQTITLEPGNRRFLTGLDAPVSFTHQNGRSIPNATWNRPLPSSRRFRYEVISRTSGELRTKNSPGRSLSILPKETPAGFRRLADEIRKAGKGDKERIEALENHFRNGNFRYSRTDLPTGDDALETFLLKTKSGHCEFFASSFALLARGAGIPARLVGGYYGGEYNELGGYYRVTDDMAHVWVEVWLAGKGWQRIDPSTLAVNADAALGGSRQRTIGIRLRLLLDSMDHRWNSAVITYDFERQLQAATEAHSKLRSLDFADIRKTLPFLLIFSIIALFFFVFFRLHNRGFFNREARILARFRRVVERRFGIPRTENLGLFDIAEKTGNPDIHDFVELYASSIYRSRKITPDEIEKLGRILTQADR